jgi:hypothetical protein
MQKQDELFNVPVFFSHIFNEYVNNILKFIPLPWKNKKKHLSTHLNLKGLWQSNSWEYNGHVRTERPLLFPNSRWKLAAGIARNLATVADDKPNTFSACIVTLIGSPSSST